MAREKMKRADPTHAVIRVAGKRNDTDPEFVSGGVNGQTYQLMREVLVPVPWHVVTSLRDAVEEKWSQDLGPDKQREFAGYTQRFPFEVVARTTEEQHRELVKRMKKRVSEGDPEAVKEEDLYDLGALT